MMTGLVMLRAIETNQSQLQLDRTTPIATMTTEAEAIVVPAKSKYKTLKDLADAFKRDPASIRWAGGSAGSTDQLLVGELARVLGVGGLTGACSSSARTCSTASAPSCPCRTCCSPRPA
jgi:putative tricarboxylic transport membrane protein